MSGCGAWPLFVAVVSSLVGTLVTSVLVPDPVCVFGWAQRDVTWGFL